MSNSTALDKALALVQRLYDRTREGKVDWQEAHGESRFVSRQGSYALVLREIPDPEYPDQPDYELAIVEEESDRTIDRITNATLRPVMDRLAGDGLNPYELMARTFEMARRTALGVDNALETILQGLGED